MKRILLILKLSGICAAAVLLVVFSEEAARSIRGSISVCVSSIIPSMFAMMAVSDYIVSGGYYQRIFRPFYFFLHPLIRLDRQTLAVFLLSLAGGYPVGIKLLREQAARDPSYAPAAEKAAAFCFCISPPFAVNLIGTGVYGSAEAGVLVYTSNVIACFLMAAVSSRFIPETKDFSCGQTSGSLLESVRSASGSLFTVCTVLIAFNAALEMAASVLNLFSVQLSPLVSGLFEISNLLKWKCPPASSLPAAAAVSAFGGICVLAQCFALCGRTFSLKKFLAGRAAGAALSAGACRVLMCFWDVAVPASSTGSGYSYRFSADKGVWVLLVLMAVIFFGKNKKIFKKG